MGQQPTQLRLRSRADNGSVGVRCLTRDGDNGVLRGLRDFLRTRMRMSHIYQPVMIKELLQLTVAGKGCKSLQIPVLMHSPLEPAQCICDTD